MAVRPPPAWRTAAVNSAASRSTVPSAPDPTDPSRPSPASTILIVDDERAIRELAAATLESHGLAVVEAGGGREALTILQTRRDIDLMIVDFEMPGMNGVAVCDMARRLRPGLPVIFLTGHGRIAALNGVPDRWIIEKPFRAFELAARVAAALPQLPVAGLDD